MTDHHEALIYAMLMVSASDGNMTDAEMNTIGEIVRTLPVFRDYDLEKLPKAAQGFAKLVAKSDGLEEVFKLIKHSLPGHLTETAYALAVDVVASDAKASQEELRLLEMMRHQLDIERLAAAGIERGAAARYIRPNGSIQSMRVAS
jgi:tellurite resistance protein